MDLEEFEQVLEWTCGNSERFRQIISGENKERRRMIIAAVVSELERLVSLVASADDRSDEIAMLAFMSGMLAERDGLLLEDK